ncbi:hypothetical protein OPV22_003849 [Ensete ventricosum]|uniref:Uncharacterized protein n=1 Tax=Ensete ventricosum TaxID=4639 RepID=A0AAV8S248_ENSVE|nr:hypothetical protein OPV22_003849 [Ensete ventricosum]
MGGCATKPQEINGPRNPDGPAAAENPSTVEPASPEAKSESVDSEESKETPLVDLSEPTGESSTATAAVAEELHPGISELKPVPEEEGVTHKAEKEKTVAAEEHPLQ